MLKVENVCASYGDLQVLFGVSFEVEEGETIALLGSNGAGKSTILSIISGLVPVQSGKITWFGKNLLEIPAHMRAELGIAHIPQGRGILGTMSVYDNLIMGTYCERVKQKRQEKIEYAFSLFPKLKERSGQIAGSLSGGEQQMLAIARAMCMEPKLLILDEPSLGLAPIVVSEMFQTISSLKKEGVSILIIEQNLVKALSISDRGYVLENGHVTISDTAENIMNNEDVKRAYIGI